ncbi:hypothetical protein HN832_00105 [archaeon]|jgi:hypothetical protein|nr:hypothetical protein [archaeon]MBT4373646.1 hypothetical protein [archaeon]MBT4531700.1 hypothetical protein [archaeon]MBT7001812.1 hypothetical protein [archaeon]MBT7281797.1 hypothetical protein [archaeon]
MANLGDVQRSREANTRACERQDKIHKMWEEKFQRKREELDAEGISGLIIIPWGRASYRLAFISKTSHRDTCFFDETKLNKSTSSEHLPDMEEPISTYQCPKCNAIYRQPLSKREKEILNKTRTKLYAN